MQCNFAKSSRMRRIISRKDVAPESSSRCWENEILRRRPLLVSRKLLWVNDRWFTKRGSIPSVRNERHCCRYYGQPAFFLAVIGLSELARYSQSLVSWAGLFLETTMPRYSIGTYKSILILTLKLQGEKSEIKSRFYFWFGLVISKKIKI